MKNRVMWIGGVDECGTGALAGPIICVAVILPIEQVLTRLADVPRLKSWWPLAGVTDSKLTTERQREAMQPRMIEYLERVGGGVGVSCGSVLDINEKGHREVLELTTLTSVREACDDRGQRPDYLIVDGNKGVCGYPGPQRIEPKADLNYFPVALASMFAKLIRDNIMAELAAEFPVYGWAQSKGYPTAAHRDALLQYGSSPHHRRKACATVVRKSEVGRRPQGW